MMSRIVAQDGFGAMFAGRYFIDVFYIMVLHLSTWHVITPLVLSLPGFLPRLIKVAPACAIMISTYEFGKAFFHKHNQDTRAAAQR